MEDSQPGEESQSEVPAPPQTASSPSQLTPSQTQQQAAVPASPNSGKATASMVMGIIGLALLLCGWVILQLPSIILGILAIIYGKMAKDEIAANPALSNEGQATAGFIMGIISCALGGIWLVIVLIAAAS